MYYIRYTCCFIDYFDPEVDKSFMGPIYNSNLPKHWP